ncbi:MAG: hypothetical protein AB4038_17450 [Prochloraceae cyanobacterium]
MAKTARRQISREPGSSERCCFSSHFNAERIPARLHFLVGRETLRYPQLVIDDANVIGITFAGTELLQEPHRSNIQGLLIDYVDFRPTINYYERTTTKFDEFIHRSQRLQEQMLVEGSAAANLEPTPVVATFVNSLNTFRRRKNTCLRRDSRTTRGRIDAYVTRIDHEFAGGKNGGKNRLKSLYSKHYNRVH